ncbi:MAG: sugar phosphate isomerase/epimerase [Acidobacteria bacterium]|nr:sugar phosphate isomerase/epimerase [Acidobacteriota bacterium]
MKRPGPAALLGLVVLVALPLRAAGEPDLVCQVYVWTQHFAARNSSFLDHIEEIFSKTREAGYRRVELMSAFVRTPELREQTAASLRRNGLELAALYHGGVFHEEAAAQTTLAETLEFAAAAQRLGCNRINFNPSPKPAKALKSEAELQVQVRYLGRLGRELRARGMSLMVHQHDAEMRENAREWRYQLRHTDPDLVGICLDLHWVYRGGQDPLELLRESGKRLAGLHLRNSRNGIWSETLDAGDIDYRAVQAYLRQAGYRGLLVVELAYEKATPITRPLEENLRRSRLFAEGIFGGAGVN